MPPAFLLWLFLWLGFTFYLCWLAWTTGFLFTFPTVGGMTGIHHHWAFSAEMGSCELFSPGIAWNWDPPNLSLPNNYNYRHKPLCLAEFFIYICCKLFFFSDMNIFCPSASCFFHFLFLSFFSFLAVLGFELRALTC
jgi:hypothetical protein